MDTKIQELTDKIYKEGVEKGNEEASRIIAEAVEKQNSILNNAQAEAQAFIAQSRERVAKESQQATQVLLSRVDDFAGKAMNKIFG